MLKMTHKRARNPLFVWLSIDVTCSFTGAEGVSELILTPRNLMPRPNLTGES